MAVAKLAKQLTFLDQDPIDAGSTVEAQTDVTPSPAPETEDVILQNYVPDSYWHSDDDGIEVAWFGAIEGARIMWADLMNSPPNDEAIIESIKDLFDPWAVLKMVWYSKNRKPN